VKVIVTVIVTVTVIIGLIFTFIYCGVGWLNKKVICTFLYVARRILLILSLLFAFLCMHIPISSVD
jgi:hypothetical protein